MANSKSWKKIFDDYKILKHDFVLAPFSLTAKQIKQSCQNFEETSEKEVRILCKQDTRESRPDIFKENGLFLLPVKNGSYAIIKGEGYIDIPPVIGQPAEYKSKLDFHLDSSIVGNSEMQHLDFAYASSLIRTFMEDPSLVLTIRGRKYTPSFNFQVNKQIVQVEGVQTEVDAGYEGRDQIVLVEAKNTQGTNAIIRQMYYPFKQWQDCTKKKVVTLFFEKNSRDNSYSIWQFNFKDESDYNSIQLNKSAKFSIV